MNTLDHIFTTSSSIIKEYAQTMDMVKTNLKPEQQNGKPLPEDVLICDKIEIDPANNISVNIKKYIQRPTVMDSNPKTPYAVFIREEKEFLDTGKNYHDGINRKVITQTWFRGAPLTSRTLDYVHKIIDNHSPNNYGLQEETHCNIDVDLSRGGQIDWESSKSMKYKANFKEAECDRQMRWYMYNNMSKRKDDKIESILLNETNQNSLVTLEHDDTIFLDMQHQKYENILIDPETKRLKTVETTTKVIETCTVDKKTLRETPHNNYHSPNLNIPIEQLISPIDPQTLSDYINGKPIFQDGPFSK